MAITTRHLIAPAVACLLLSFAAPASAKGDAPAKPAEAGVKVEMVTAGKGKKAPLRYTFSKGHTEKLTMKSRVRMAVEIAGRKTPEQTLPVVEFDVSAKTTAIDGDGNALVDVKIVDVRLAEQGALPDEMAKEYRAAIAKLRKLTGNMTITPRGELLAVSIAREKIKDRGLAPLLEAFEGILAQATIPLPEIAVGVGAKWTTEQDVDMSGATLNQKVTFELEERKGKAFVLGIDVSVDNKGKTQRVMLPGAPPSVVAKVVKADGDGKGSIDVAAGTAIAGSKMTIDTNLELTVAPKAGAPPRKMTMVMKTLTTVERKD